ncbi:MAG: hypothetical protein IJ526_12265 [Lachnospiraceae bacterium]|nr:hypothetical protein [Lachnospiraceae bacterium]
MTFTQLPEILRGVMLTFTTVVIIINIIVFIKIMYVGMRNRMLPVITGSGLIVFFLYQSMCMYQEHDYDSFDCPVIILATVISASFVFGLYCLFYITKWQRGNISQLSVKEAFDTLPTGLCYYTADGVPLMVNESMQAISRSITGGNIVDANDFAKKVNDIAHAGDRVYNIRGRMLTIDNTSISEMVAADVTQEYALTKQLEEGRDKAKLLNSRLKALMGTIEYVTMNKELLKIKTVLHDNIGQSILIAKRYLVSDEPGSVDDSEMISFWKENIKHLLTDEPEEWELPYYVISKEADRLGVHLDIAGDLPDAQTLIPVVDAAISVSVGNALKHAGGKKVAIFVLEKDGLYIIKFTNDGRAPIGPVVEKGGLANLRREVESVGGTMEVTHQPEFLMTITLPKPGV